MKIDVRIVDVADQLQTKPDDTPYVLLKREVAETHLRTPVLVPGSNELYEILQGPMDQEHSWSKDNGGSHVAIPLYPYVFAEQAELLVQFGLQFGAASAAEAVGTATLLILQSVIYARPDHKPGYCVYVGIAKRKES